LRKHLEAQAQARFGLLLLYVCLTSQDSSELYIHVCIITFKAWNCVPVTWKTCFWTWQIAKGMELKVLKFNKNNKHFTW